MKRHLLILLFIAALAMACSAERATLAPQGVRGRVRDLATGRSLGQVRLSGGGAETTTDPWGRYSLDLPPGLYELAAEREGYIAMSQARIRVAAGQVTELDWELIPATPTDKEAKRVDAQVRQLSQDGPEEGDWPAGYAITAVTETPQTLRVLMPDGSVVTMSLEEYLRGVVPSEVGAGWPTEALRAQAVAARSYAATRHAHADVGADVCTTTHCQVWNNIHYATTDQAILDTAGVVGRYGGNIISAFFFGHCDGHTRNSEDVWSGYVPYCRAVSCPCGYTTMWGHGVGMCQEGARVMASQGASYVQILKHYYTGIEVPPRLSLDWPVSGAAVRGVILPQVTTGGQVSAMAYYIDGALRASSETAALAWYWNTVEETDGLHTLRVVVRDGAAPSGTLYEVQAQVRVDNTPPAGEVSAPAWHNSASVTFGLAGSDATQVQFSNGWAWEGEMLPHWAGTAQPVADPSASQGAALLGQAGVSIPGAWFGPYTCDLPEGRSYDVYYRLKTGDRTPDTGLATVDIADNQGARTYGQRTLAARAFGRNNVYEEFALRLAYAQKAPTCAQPDSGNGLEFRTWYSGLGDLYLDRIAVFSLPQPTSQPLAWQVAEREGAQQVMVRLLDAAGNIADRPMTVRLDLTAPAWLTATAPLLWTQDTLSGLDTPQAAYAYSIDGGHQWSAWLSLPLGATMGITTPIALVAPPEPEGALRTHVRYRMRDLAGSIVESAALALPLEMDERYSLPILRD